MTTTRKSIARTASPAAVAVTGAVIGKDDVLFVRPKTAKERTAAGAANVSVLRDLVSQADKIGQGILARLVLALVLNPTTKTDDKGRTVDALSALTSGDGALTVPRPEISKARAAFRLVDKAGIGSTADPRWQAVLQVTGRAGVGADRVDAFLKGKSQNRVLAALEAISEAKGDDKAAAIRKSFPSKGRQADGGTVGSAEFRKAEAAVKVLMDVADGMTDKAEREAIHGLLARLTDRYSKAPAVKVDATA